MELHPQASTHNILKIKLNYARVELYCTKYPEHGAAFFQTFLDLNFVQGSKVENCYFLDQLKRPVLINNIGNVFVPTDTTELWSPKKIDSIYQNLEAFSVSYPNLNANIQKFTLAIVDSDSTVVYYNFSHGIFAPVE
ncbi:hypothetical protein BB561_002750 [Smittium simulii]|uniref:tRNA-splicing endonuclease subunit Sen15 domain-containing protein n=1 Tax=Smittium simulii TaxID=133385 RepID=A0A2T9YPF2_9FUNG|nr:hypothetical protein BB561_002750 [Smittium simulii]